MRMLKLAIPREVVNDGNFLPTLVQTIFCFSQDWSLSLAIALACTSLLFLLNLVQAPLPESYFGSPESDDSLISVQIVWLILVLLCKLDDKAEHHKDVALRFLTFLQK